jgi:hypothetical protein
MVQAASRCRRYTAGPVTRAHTAACAPFPRIAPEIGMQKLSQDAENATTAKEMTPRWPHHLTAWTLERFFSV